MSSLMSQIEKFKEARNKSKIKQEIEYEEIRKEYERKKSLFNQFRTSHLRPAGKRDYKKWLKGWLVEHEITYYYDYAFPRDEFYVATSDFILNEAFYGSLSFQIIVPKGIKYTVEALGHCNIYDLNTFDCIGGWIPAYSDLHI